MADSPIWISEADVVQLMDMPGAIRALEAGLRAEARGAAANMTKTHVEWPSTLRPFDELRVVPSHVEGREPQGRPEPRRGATGSGRGDARSTLHAIGATFPDAGFVGTKTWAHTEGGATPLLVLFDSANGSLKAIVEAFALGQLRTGAASGVATDQLALRGADELGVVGTGKQSLTQIAAVAAVRPLRRVRVFGRDAARRAQCAARVRDELGLEAVEAMSIADAVRNAPIVTLVTRAKAPFLTADMVARGTHINAVGAITPAGVEVAPDVLPRCNQVVADSVPQAQRLSTELIAYFGAVPGRWDLVRSLATVVAEGKGRRDDDDLTFFKSLGMGISDLSLGIEIYRKALGAGFGRPLTHPKKVAPRLRPAAPSEIQ